MNDAIYDVRQEKYTAVERNVRWSVRTIIESPEGRARVAEGRVKFVATIYEIETGRVRSSDVDHD